MQYPRQERKVPEVVLQKALTQIKTLKAFLELGLLFGNLELFWELLFLGVFKPPSLYLCPCALFSGFGSTGGLEVWNTTSKSGEGGGGSKGCT